MTAPDNTSPAEMLLREKRLILILNGKGGVGKSFFAVNVIQWLKEQRVAHKAFDSDNENSTLKRFHPETHFIHLEKRQKLDAIFSALEEHDLVVVDCRAASTDIILEYFEEIDLDHILEQSAASLLIVSPVNHEADSVEQIRTVSDHLKSICLYLVVRNQSHSEEFTIYDGSRTREILHNDLGASDITMPKLYDWLVTKLNLISLPASLATQSEEISLMDQQRLRNWTKRFGGELETVREILIPSSAVTS